LWFIRRAQAITGRTVRLLQDLEAVAKVRYEAGKTSFQDVIKVQVRRELLAEKLRTLREQQRNEKINIQQLLDMGPGAEVGVPQVNLAEAYLPALDRLYALALEHRQELRRMRARIGKMERMIEMAETMILPDFSLGLSLYPDEAIQQVGWMATRPAFTTPGAAAMGVGLPKKPGFGAADAYLREIRQKRQAMQEALNHLEASTIAEVRNKWFAVDQAAREKRLYQRTLLQLSQAALEVSTSGYESGKVSFADVISSFTLWLDTHLALANRQSSYGIRLAELEQAVGQSFTQRQKP
jgi:outer membrane protein TolC